MVDENIPNSNLDLSRDSSKNLENIAKNTSTNPTKKSKQDMLDELYRLANPDIKPTEKIPNPEPIKEKPKQSNKSKQDVLAELYRLANPDTKIEEKPVYESPKPIYEKPKKEPKPKKQKIPKPKKVKQKKVKIPQPKKEKAPKPKSSGIKKWVGLGLKTTGALIAAGIVGGTIYYQSIKGSLPTPTDIESIQQGVVTKVYSSDGRVVKDYFKENRQMAPLDEIPQFLIDGLIATEDVQFYKHNGINFRGYAGAVKTLLTKGKVRGGSGLTQQLAKNLFVGRKKTPDRKIRELFAARGLEKVYSKDKILELYLNQVYLGGVYGVKAASEKYFDKDLDELSKVECALFAGMVQRPEAFRPDKNPKDSFKRKNQVLYRLFAVGKIDKEEYDKLKDEKLVVKKGGAEGGIGAYFVEEVRKKLTPNVISYEDFYSRGYNIFTTLNYDFQKIAEEHFNRVIAEKEKAHGGKVNGALVSIDNLTGAIVAMVGGSSFKDNEFNCATQALRSPGSSFKPLVYAAAFDNGYNPESIILDVPFVRVDAAGNEWSPENYKPDFVGPITIRETCANSRNNSSIILGNDLGIENVINYARMFGLTSSLRPYPSLFIGGACEATPLEMAAAYTVFVNGGVYKEPYMIDKVTLRSSKETIFQHTPVERTALSADAAAMTVDVLESVIEDGTGRSARWKYKLTVPAGGKTGTTDRSVDLWFVGFTPQYTTAVWVGRGTSKSLGHKETGASAALPIWAPYMRDIHKDLPDQDFSYKSRFNNNNTEE